MSDRETLDFYDGAAEEYAGTFGPDTPDETLQAFLETLRAGGRILDFGCGPGHWAAMMRDAGYAVEATDASQGMADLAFEKFGLSVRVEPFEALDKIDYYDGVWANFSLLHEARAKMPAHLSRLRRALKPRGILHLGLKVGDGQERDRLGRSYTYYREPELRALLADAGFSVTSALHGTERGMAGTDDPFMIVLAHA